MKLLELVYDQEKVVINVDHIIVIRENKVERIDTTKSEIKKETVKEIEITLTNQTSYMIHVTDDFSIRKLFKSDDDVVVLKDI